MKLVGNAIAVVMWSLLLRKPNVAPVSRRIEALAVLPLKNISGDRTQDDFAVGMTDAIIADLAQIESLRVISHTSVMQFKDTNKSLPEIARQLDVQGIIEGTVLRSGNRVQIRTELIDPATERHVLTGLMSAIWATFWICKTKSRVPSRMRFRQS